MIKKYCDFCKIEIDNPLDEEHTVRLKTGIHDFYGVDGKLNEKEYLVCNRCFSVLENYIDSRLMTTI